MIPVTLIGEKSGVNGTFLLASDDGTFTHSYSNEIEKARYQAMGMGHPRIQVWKKGSFDDFSFTILLLVTGQKTLTVGDVSVDTFVSSDEMVEMCRKIRSEAICESYGSDTNMHLPPGRFIFKVRNWFAIAGVPSKVTINFQGPYDENLKPLRASIDITLSVGPRASVGRMNATQEWYVDKTWTFTDTGR